MQVQDNSIMVSMLRKEFPDIAAIIENKIKEKLPDKILADLSILPCIINNFKELFIHNLDERNKIQFNQSKDRIWCRLSSDEYRFLKVTEIREMLIAVILMFYHPERILGLTDVKSRTKSGIVKHLSKILNCYKEDISNSLTSSIIYYKSYNGFKHEVDYLYEEIKKKGNYFKDL